MADNQQYPDSNGARWEAPATGQQGPAERPAFLDRTAPMSRQDREARAQDTSMDDLIGSRNRTSRLPSQDRPDEQIGGFGVPQPAAPQWNPEPATTAPPQQPQQLNEPGGDPELAAMSRMDAPRQVSPPMPPPEAHRPPMAQPTPPPDLNEPTQLHNPVASAPPAQQQQPQQRGGTYGGSSSQSGGVYQSNAANLGSLAWIAALVIAMPIVYVMIRALAAGGNVILSGAVASGMFALAGLPLTAYGLQAALKHKPGPEGISPLRAPYVYLVTGLVLILAAGMAAG